MSRRPLTHKEASLLASQEYESLQATYSSLFKSVSLKESNHLEVITLEGDKFTVRVTSEGWKVVEGGTHADRERTWEMVEDLLRSVSSLFKQGWDMTLLEKLHALADFQQDEANDLAAPKNAQ